MGWKCKRVLCGDDFNTQKIWLGKNRIEKKPKSETKRMTCNLR